MKKITKLLLMLVLMIVGTSNALADDYVAKVIGNDVYNDFYATSLSAAYEEAKSRGGTSENPVTITILKDCETYGLSISPFTAIESWNIEKTYYPHIKISCENHTLTTKGQIYIGSDCSLVIADGTVRTTSSADHAFYVNAGYLTVDDGIIDASKGSGDAVKVDSYGHFTANGGTFIGSYNTVDGYALELWHGYATLNGGIFAGSAGGLRSSYSTVSLGTDRQFYTLSGFQWQNYTATGIGQYYAEIDINQTVMVASTAPTTKYIAMVHGIPYASLNEAITAAADASTSTCPVAITLLGNCETSGFTLQSGYVDISGGNYTLTMTNKATVSGGSLTITDGTFKATSAVTDEAFLVSGGTLTVNGGTIDASGSKANAVNVNGFSAAFIVNDGTFIGSSSSSKRGLAVQSGTATLNGGTFSGKAGSISVPSGKAVTTILGDGKEYFEQSDDNWVLYTGDKTSNTIDKTVKVDYNCVAQVGNTLYETFAEAYQAAKSSIDTPTNPTIITLLKDCAVGNTTSNTSDNIVISCGNHTLTIDGFFEVYCNLTIQDGTFKFNNVSNSRDGAFHVAFGSLTVNDCTIDASSTEKNAVYVTQYNAKFTANGGTFIGSANTEGKRGLVVESGGSATLNGGTFSGNAGGISVPDGTAVTSILGDGKEYFNVNGSAYTGDLNSNTIDQTVMVKDAPKPTTFSLNETAKTKTLGVGTTVTLTKSDITSNGPTYALRHMTLSSSDENVVTVDNTNHSYTAVGVGTATITVTVEGTTLTDAITVTAKKMTNVYATSGSAGATDAEQPCYLFDGKYTSTDGTKWCTKDQSTNNVCFETTEAVKLTKYTLYTANDNATETGRNPKVWTLYASTDGVTYDKVLDQRTDNTTMKDVNYTGYEFTIPTEKQGKYKYYKLDITATQGADVFQLGEMVLTTDQGIDLIGVGHDYWGDKCHICSSTNSASITYDDGKITYSLAPQTNKAAIASITKDTEVDIPLSVTKGNIEYTIKKIDFGNLDNTTTSITCHATTPAEATNMDGVDKTACTLYVPEAAVETYKATEPYSGFSNIKAIGTSYVAQVNDGTKYTSFNDAFVAAINAGTSKNPATITLLEDCETPGVNVKDKQYVTISGGTHTLTLTQNHIDVLGGALTIKDGTFKLISNSGNNAEVFKVSGGTLTVDGGTIDASGSSNANARGLVVSAGTATLNGGTFSGHDGGIYVKNGVNTILGEGKGYFEQSGDHWVSYTGDTSSNSIDKTVKIAPSGSTGIVFNDAEAYSKNSDTKYGWLEYNRTYWDNDWNCLYVPFETTAGSYTDCEIYDIGKFDQNGDQITLKLTKLKDDATVQANHPYLIKYVGTVTAYQMADGKDVTTMIKGATLKAAATNNFKYSTTSYEITFKGTYSAIDAATAADNHYTLIYSDTDGKMIIAKPTNGIKPQRWYMTVTDRSGSSSAKMPTFIITVDEGDTTGVEEISNSGDRKLSDTGVYTISGQRLSEPRHGEINIIGGKKVFVE